LPPVGGAPGTYRPSTTRGPAGGRAAGRGPAVPDPFGGVNARPRPRSTRPGCSAAIVPNCSAATSGLVVLSSTAPLPTRMRSVRAATAAASTAGDAEPTPGDRWCSAYQTRWYPSRSRSRASPTARRTASWPVDPSGTIARSRTDRGTRPEAGRGPPGAVGCGCWWDDMASSGGGAVGLLGREPERGERGPQVGAPAQRARHAQAVDDALAPPAVESLRAVEGLDALLVGRDVLGLAGGPVPLGVQDCALRQARLDALAARGVRVPDDEADGGHDALGQPELRRDLRRVVAQRADVHRAETQRLGRDDRVLRGERGVEERGERGLEVVGGLEPHALARPEGAHAGEVGEPHEQERRRADVLLVARERREARLAGRVRDGDDAPELEVRGRRGGLRSGHEGRDDVLGERVGEVAAHGA